MRWVCLRAELEFITHSSYLYRVGRRGDQLSDALPLPPADERLTAHDRQLAKTYLRLLDADAAGATWQEAACYVFGVDPTSRPEELERTHAAHLARAKWLRDGGYLRLLAQPAG